MLKNIFETKEFRFLLVGILNTLVGYGLYALFLSLHINYLIANTMSTILGIIHSYLWNRFFTFKSKEKAGKEIVKFFFVYLISYLIGCVTLYIFKNKLNIDVYLAGLLNLVITTIISFFGHKYFSFKEKKVTLKEIWQENKKFILPSLLFLLSFGLLLSYKNLPNFTDEGDVMLGATLISKGKIPYLDFASQHLPFTYYYMAIFALLGIHSVVGFRIGMYLMLSVLFVFMYLRYHKTFGKLPFFLYPFFYTLYMSFPDYTAGTIISEQFVSQFLVILFLEILMFYKNKKLDTLSLVLIPLMMVLSIGSSFVSILAVFAAVLAFVFLDIKFYLQENKFKLSSYLQHFFKKYKVILLVGIGLVGIFVLYLALSGSLMECYKQAFQLNTEVYAKYNSYSSNPIVTMIKAFPRFFLSITSFLTLNTYSLLYIILYLGVIIFTYKLSKKDYSLAFLMFFYILMCGNRGFTDFHALPFFAAAIIGICLMLSKLDKKKLNICLCLFLILFVKVRGVAYQNILKPREEKEMTSIVKLLNEDEQIMHVDIDTSSYIDEGKIPYGPFASMVPWFADIYEDEYLQIIKDSHSKVITYYPYNTVWSVPFKEFLPKVNEYIIKNYVFVKDGLYFVHPDYLKEASRKLNRMLPYYNNCYDTISFMPLVNNSVKETIEVSKTTEKLGIMFGTYSRVNYSLLHFTMKKDGTIIYDETISASELKDNDYYYLKLKEALEPNETYELEISSSNTNDKDYVAIYKMNDEVGYDENYLTINGITYKNEDLVMEMYDEKENN